MLTITVSGWCLLVAAGLLIGVAKTGFPGAGILAIPMAVIACNGQAKASAGVVLPMLIVGDVLATLYYRRQAETKYVAKLVPCAVLGILIGNYCMGIVTDAELKPFIGGVVLIMLILNWWRNWRMARSGEIHVPKGWWFPVLVGTLAGITTMLANAAGPIMVVYLLAMRLPKDQFIGTGAWYFLSLNLFKVPFYWHQGLITPHSLWIDAHLAPIILIGGVAGIVLIRFVPQKWFTWIVQVLAAVAALQLLISALLAKAPTAVRPLPPAPTLPAPKLFR